MLVLEGIVSSGLALGIRQAAGVVDSAVVQILNAAKRRLSQTPRNAHETHHGHKSQMPETNPQGPADAAESESREACSSSSSIRSTYSALHGF